MTEHRKGATVEASDEVDAQRSALESRYSQSESQGERAAQGELGLLSSLGPLEDEAAVSEATVESSRDEGVEAELGSAQEERGRVLQPAETTEEPREDLPAETRTVTLSELTRDATGGTVGEGAHEVKVAQLLYGLIEGFEEWVGAYCMVRGMDQASHWGKPLIGILRNALGGHVREIVLNESSLAESSRFIPATFGPARASNILNMQRESAVPHALHEHLENLEALLGVQRARGREEERLQAELDEWKTNPELAVAQVYLQAVAPWLHALVAELRRLPGIVVRWSEIDGGEDAARFLWTAYGEAMGAVGDFPALVVATREARQGAWREARSEGVLREADAKQAFEARAVALLAPASVALEVGEDGALAELAVCPNRFDVTEAGEFRWYMLEPEALAETLEGIARALGVSHVSMVMGTRDAHGVWAEASGRSPPELPPALSGASQCVRVAERPDVWLFGNGGDPAMPMRLVLHLLGLEGYAARTAHQRA